MSWTFKLIGIKRRGKLNPFKGTGDTKLTMLKPSAKRRMWSLNVTVKFQLGWKLNSILYGQDTYQSNNTTVVSQKHIWNDTFPVSHLYTQNESPQHSYDKLILHFSHEIKEKKLSNFYI